MSKLPKSLLLSACSLGILGSASGAVISYSEGADASGVAAPLSLGSLGLGINTFSGNVSFGTGDGNDAYTFDLPLGLKISEVRYDTGVGNVGTAGQVRLMGDSVDFWSGTLINEIDGIGANTQAVVWDTVIEDVGSYAVYQGGLSGAGNNTNYTWVITTEAASTPEPSTAILGCLGALGLLARRRR